jgi:catechol 2,3-dioxygenase-like lactoylglutathione lyase family enzyme
LGTLSGSRRNVMGLSGYRVNTQVAVSDMTRAAEFYEGKLGLSAAHSGADGSKAYSSGGDTSLVVYPAPDTAGGSTATLATGYVDDVKQVVDELTSRGVAFEQYQGVLESGFDYSTDERGVSPRAGGGSVAWFKDPDGNILSIESDR